MGTGPSPRLLAIVDALPLRKGMRVLEVGCGPGAAAREIARRIGRGHVLGIDRSATAIAQAKAGSRAEIASGVLSFRQAAIEDFELETGEAPYDIALAVRVGALDGRHPHAEAQAKRRIAAALTPRGRLFIDGGNPLRESHWTAEYVLRALKIEALEHERRSSTMPDRYRVDRRSAIRRRCVERPAKNSIKR